MGRVAGVTAAETRRRLLRAAADLPARRDPSGNLVEGLAAARRDEDVAGRPVAAQTGAPQ